MVVIPNRDKALLYPPLVAQLTIFEARLVEKRLSHSLFMGFRSHADQNHLYRQGRQTPGPLCHHKGEARPRPIGQCPKHPLGYMVTNARGGDSWHQYGLAGDYVLDGQIEKPGIQWSWERVDLNQDGQDDWLQMGLLAEECGLEWGGRWKAADLPHVQNRFGLTLPEIKEIHRLGGIEAVWEAAA